MAVFIARPGDESDAEVVPLFFETTGSHANLRVRSGLREVARAEGRITTHEPSHIRSRFTLRKSDGEPVAAIQTSASGGPFQDRFDVVFEWLEVVQSGDEFTLGCEDTSVTFVALSNPSA